MNVMVHQSLIPDTYIIPCPPPDKNIYTDTHKNIWTHTWCCRTRVRGTFLLGEKGIFPGSYVNIVVDCTKIQEEKPELAELEKLLCDSFYLVAGSWYKVVFSFTGEREGDLGVQMGELVRVVSHSDTHWCWVMNSRSVYQIIVLKVMLYNDIYS